MNIDLKNIDTIKNYIEKNEIIYVDLRWLTAKSSANYYSSVSVHSFYLDKIYKNINVIDSFEDPFLIHKTLVLIIDSPFNIDLLKNFKCIEFKLEDDVKNSPLEIIFLAPDLDVNRDIRGEISMTLINMGINVILHLFDDSKKNHVIYFKENIVEMDFCKIQYVINMICKVYNKNYTINNMK
jgi:hypothetical protein